MVRPIQIKLVLRRANLKRQNKKRFLRFPQTQNLEKINFETLVPIFFVTISFLLICKFPTYSLKKIVVPRSTTIFLLFGIVLYFGFLLIYTFKAMFISGMLYLCFIPISLTHYFKLNKKYTTDNTLEENHEDIL